MSEQNHPSLPWQPQPDMQAAEPPRVLPPVFPAVPGGKVQPPRELEDLQYHRLSHADPRTRWWSPLAEGGTGAAIWVVLNIIIGLIFGAWALTAGINQAELTLEGLQNNVLTSPVFFLLMFGTVALMYPVLRLVRLIFGPKPWGLVHSVAGRMRWKWLMVCTGLSALLFVLIPVVFALFTGGTLAVEAHLPANTFIWLMVLVFLLVPIQCYAEELVFRGYLMQTIGRWLKHPAWVIILPAPLFMLGHAYDVWGQLSILVMGLAAGFMVWYTGGLEASIAMHVVNNMYLMFMGVLGLADPFAQEGSTFADFLFASGVEIVLVLMVMYAARKMGIARSGRYHVAISPERWKEIKSQSGETL